MNAISTLRDVFSNPGFMPHLHCYLGKPSLVWTMVVTDMLIGLSYVSISLTLVRMLREIRLPFSMVFLAFGTFIAACGGTHFMEVYNLWIPDYWAAAGVKALTAIASVVTAVWLLSLKTGIVGFVKERQASIAQTSARLELALSAANMGVWDFDVTTKKLEWSETMKRLFGYETSGDFSDDVMFMRRLHPDNARAVSQRLRHLIEGTTNTLDKLEFRIVWPTGAVHWIAVQGRVIRDPAGLPMRVIGTAMNIDAEKQSRVELEQLVVARTTELSRAQANLAQAAKLSSLGEMAAGVAHEINTPLAAISLQAHQAARLLQKNNSNTQPRILEKVELIQKTAQRIASIIHGLRAFAREAASDPFEAVAIETLIENASSLCQMRFKHHSITLQIDNAVGPGISVECRPAQIAQILLNLLNNAFDAVNELPNRWVRISALDEGDTVEIAVTDSGSGISPEIVDKMMQPFFTTKEVGRGTGLGLSISTGLAQANGGSIGFDSQSEHTRFVLHLPKQQINAQPKVEMGHELAH